MEQRFIILEKFEENWPAYKKDQPFRAHAGNRSGYAIAFEVGVLHVVFAALQGPKGGITGALLVVDTSKSVVIDKLLCGNCDIMRTQQPISQLYIEVHCDGHDFHEAAPPYLLNIMQEWKLNPALITTVADLVGFGNTSVPTFSGGAVSPR